MRALSYKYIQRSAVEDAVAGANSPGEPLAFFLSEPLVTREPNLRRRSVWLVACDEMAALTQQVGARRRLLARFSVTAFTSP